MDSLVFSDELIAKISEEAPEHIHGLASYFPPEPKPIGSLEKVFKNKSGAKKEIVSGVLGSLDLQSLSRFSQSCLQARRLVRDFRPYQEILRHAPTLPHILARTTLLPYFSAQHLFSQLLRSDRCSSCGGFGAFAFLLTCERVCMSCFTAKDDFHVIGKPRAMYVFRLSAEQLDAVPSYYCSLRKIFLVRTKELQDMNATTKISLVRDKELQDMSAASNCSCFSSDFGDLDDEEICTTRLNSTVPNPYRPPFHFSGLDKNDVEYYSTMINSTALFLPFPSEAGLDSGRICAACLRAAQRAGPSPKDNRVSPSVWNTLIRIRQKVYSRIEFLGHVKICPAQRLDEVLG